MDRGVRRLGCKLGECLEAIEFGLIDIGDAHAPFEPAKMLAHNFAFFAPFGAPDPRVAAKAVREVYETTPALRKVLEDRYNQVFVAVGIVGNYGLITNFKWNTVADLKGHKIAPAGPNLPWLQGTGVVGVQSTLNEAYTSMQTGVYEGGDVHRRLDELQAQRGVEAICRHGLRLHQHTGHHHEQGYLEGTASGGAEDHPRGRPRLQRGDRAHHAREAGGGAQPHEGGRPRGPRRCRQTKEAWAKALPNIPKLRFEEINKANMPGEVVYNYIKALKAAGHIFPRDWEAER